MRLRGHILPIGTRLFLLLVLSVFLGLPLSDSGQATACWNTMLAECFDDYPTDWPWQAPPGSGRRWRISPNPPQNTWGIQTRIFDDAMCPEDDRGAWCMGLPASNDPFFDTYPPNHDSYMTYGPLNLSSAVEAQVSFWYWNDCEAVNDSFYWGAATNFQLTNTNMYQAGRHWGDTDGDFRQQSMDLSDLRRVSTGDSASLIGQSVVYIFWRFKANWNTQVGVGPVVDNVVVSVDDGGVDMMAVSLEPMNPDTTPLLNDPEFGDTLIAKFVFSTCTGGIGIYDEFQVTGWSDDVVILDTLMTEVGPGVSYSLYTDSWIIDAVGDHQIRIEIDPQDAIDETNEGNNISIYNYFIYPPNYPPEFTWIVPGESGDTLRADGILWLKWECYDSEEQASINIFYDNDTLNCSGLLIEGGISEIDGLDSTDWNLTGISYNSVKWVFAEVFDAVNDVCYFAQFPVKREIVAADDPVESLVPETHYLSQNYPNPFNPATRIEYGVAEAGQITLQIFDLLGREAAVLVNNRLTPGHYHATFDGAKLATGIYIYRLTTPEGILARKMILMK